MSGVTRPTTFRDELYKSLIRKLHPDLFPGMSGRMAAIVGYVLRVEWTRPTIQTLSVTSDGYLVSDAVFIGEYGDFERNMQELAKAANLTEPELSLFWTMWRFMTDDWRHVGGA